MKLCLQAVQKDVRETDNAKFGNGHAMLTAL